MLELLLLGLPVAVDEWVVPPPVLEEITVADEAVADPCALASELGLSDIVRCIATHEVSAPASFSATLETAWFRLRLWDAAVTVNRVDAAYSAHFTGPADFTHFRGYVVPVCQDADTAALTINGPGTEIFNSTIHDPASYPGGRDITGYLSVRVSGACPFGDARRLLAFGTWNDNTTQQTIWFAGDGYRHVDGWLDLTNYWQTPSGERFTFDILESPAVGDTGDLRFTVTATGLAAALDSCGTSVSCRSSAFWAWTGFDSSVQAAGLSFQYWGGTLSLSNPNVWRQPTGGCAPVVVDVQIECVRSVVVAQADGYALRFPTAAFFTDYRAQIVYYPTGATDRPIFDGRQMVQATLTDWVGLADIEWVPEQRTESIWESTGLCESVSDCFDQCTIGNPITDFGGFLDGLRCWIVPDFDIIQVFTGLNDSFQATVAMQTVNFNRESIVDGARHALAQERQCGALVNVRTGFGPGGTAGQVVDAVNTCRENTSQAVNIGRIIMLVIISIGTFFGLLAIIGWGLDIRWYWQEPSGDSDS